MRKKGGLVHHIGVSGQTLANNMGAAVFASIGQTALSYRIESRANRLERCADLLAVILGYSPNQRSYSGGITIAAAQRPLRRHRSLRLRRRFAFSCSSGSGWDGTVPKENMPIPQTAYLSPLLKYFPVTA
jgi:hypothetical protein